MNVFIISAFDPIPGDDAQIIRYATLANIFARNNHSVNYFSSSFFHLNKTQRQFNTWQDSNYEKHIKLHLIKTNSYKKNVSLLRLINHYFFSHKLSRLFNRMISTNKPDLVIVAFPPVLSAYHIVRHCNKNKIPVVIDIQDLWPEAFRMIIDIKPLYNIATFLLLHKRNLAFSRATKLSCVSDTYKSLLSEYKKPESIKVVKLGFNTALFQQNISEKWDLIQKGNSEKWIVFLGTSSHIPDVLNIPDIALKMPGYHFLLLGKNLSFDKIKRDIIKKELKNVSVIGNTSFHNIVNILSRSDAGLLFIDPLSGTSLPNKLFYYLLAGLPVVSNYNNSDLNKLSRELNCIFFTGAPDHIGFKGSIEKAVSLSLTERNKIRNFALDHFDSEKIYSGFYKWATEISS